MPRLNILISDAALIKKDMSNANSRNIGFYKSRLQAINEKLRKFGQRYNIIKLTIIYSDKKIADAPQEHGEVFYTDIAMQDAIDYTKSLMCVNYTLHNITAIEIPTGRVKAINLGITKGL